VASNFGIRISEKNDGFTLKLDGDFDVTSAYELIYAIKKLPGDTAKIYVNTNGLKKIHASGLDVLIGFMNSLNGLSTRIDFAGHNASQFSIGNSRSTPNISKFFIKELNSPYV
jgi:ABC-type transporter Mla MlaB component